MDIISKIRNQKMQFLLIIGLAISLIATTGSLYFSEVMNFRPCKLCWFQRIFTYPQVIIFSVALVRSRKPDFDYRLIYMYGAIMSFIATFIASYHSYIQLADSGGICTGGCSIVLYRAFGIFSIPNQSLIANLTILVICAIGLYKTKNK